MGSLHTMMVAQRRTSPPTRNLPQSAHGGQVGELAPLHPSCRCYDCVASSRGPVAQWQSSRLITDRSQVRSLPGPCFRPNVTEFITPGSPQSSVSGRSSWPGSRAGPGAAAASLSRQASQCAGGRSAWSRRGSRAARDASVQWHDREGAPRGHRVPGAAPERPFGSPYARYFAHSPGPVPSGPARLRIWLCRAPVYVPACLTFVSLVGDEDRSKMYQELRCADEIPRASVPCSETDPL